MSPNLIELFKNTVGDSLVRQTSGSIGESAQSISSSLESIVPSLLGTMILKGNTDAGARGLLDFISGNGLEDITLNEASFLEGGNGIEQLMAKGSGVLQYLVGDKVASMVDWISGGGGLKTSSASSLLKIAAPLLMGFFGRLIKEGSLNASGVKDLLLSQSEYVTQGTPKGPSELLGFSSLGKPAMAPSINMASSGGTNAPAGSGGMSKFLPWLILVLASLGLFYFLQKGCNSSAPPVDSISSQTSAPSADTASNATAKLTGPKTDKGKDSISASLISGTSDKAKPPLVTGTGRLKTYTLPNGSKLIVESNKFTSLMIDYLSGNEPAGKCIPFDEVSFEPGTDKITPKSTEQLSHLNLLLNDYPKMQIMITGYTDNVGDAEKNRKLSEARAFAVRTWHIHQGIPSTRLQSKGLGEANPIEPNDTKEGQAKNRRVEVCVVKKR